MSDEHDPILHAAYQRRSRRVLYVGVVLFAFGTVLQVAAMVAR